MTIHDSLGKPLRIGDRVRHNRFGYTGTFAHTALGPEVLFVDWDPPAPKYGLGVPAHRRRRCFGCFGPYCCPDLRVIDTPQGEEGLNG